MSMLATPDTIAGPLTAADLDAARKHSTGRILPAGCDQQGRYPTRRWEPWPDTVPTDHAELDDCATEGGTHRDPVDSKTFQAGPAIGIVLVLATGIPFLIAVINLVMALSN